MPNQWAISRKFNPFFAVNCMGPHQGPLGVALTPTTMHYTTVQGAFHAFEKGRRFFRTKGFYAIFDGFFFEAEEFLPKVNESFWSEMPLGVLALK